MIMKKRGSFLIPSIADFIFLSLFLYLSFGFGIQLLNDGDTGYHIRAGEYIIENLSIPKLDIFSFHTPPLPWTAHEWLSEVIMANVHSLFGLTGIVIFFSFIISISYFYFFKFLQKNNENIVFVSFIVLLTLMASQFHWLARPHIFSLPLMIIWYYLLDEYQYNDRNYLYLFPLLMLIWVNLHGGFLVGFVLVGIYLFGNIVKFIKSENDDKNIYKIKVKQLALVTVVCFFVSLINPYTYQILFFPFNLVSNKFIMDHVGEFMAPNFHRLSMKPFEFMLLLLFSLLVFSKKRLNIIEMVLLLLFVHMSLYSARYIPLFSIIIAPILLRQLREMVKRSNGKLAKFFKKRSDNISEIDSSARGYLWPVSALILVIFFVGVGKIDFKFDPKKKPVEAVEFLKKEHIAGHMFADDEFGDYIIYSTWPEYKVFFDGRSDMYGVDIMKEYLKITGVEPGWNKVLKKYDITWIMHNANSTLSLFLMEKNDWKLIYADKVANIFVKNIPENQYLIQKYPDVELITPEDFTFDRSMRRQSRI